MIEKHSGARNAYIDEWPAGTPRAVTDRLHTWVALGDEVRDEEILLPPCPPRRPARTAEAFSDVAATAAHWQQQRRIDRADNMFESTSAHSQR